MRLSKLYLASVLTLASVGIVGCSDNFDTPPMVIPHTDIQANITIKDLKTQYWNSARNYIDTIGFAENGDSLYIRARVISSDESGNIYNSLYIQDETGALPLSIRYPDMFNTYRIGQEVVLSVSGMYIGKYNGLQQLGQPEYSEEFGWEATFMSRELFESRVLLNGLPDASQIDTVVVALDELTSSTEDLIKYQGQLVRINDVRFEEADGETTFSDSETSTSRTLVDENGNEIVMRNSSYASFQPDVLPLGTGDVVGILGYYGNTGWQLVIRDTDDLIGFTTDTSGTKVNPYTIEQAIELQGEAEGWVTGYIVGAVAPEIGETIDSNDDIQWEAPFILGNTLVIGATPNTRDIAQCIVMELPQNSALRTAANLHDNPGVLGTQIWVKGKLESYMGTFGLTGNSGSSSEFSMSVATGGVASLSEDFSGNDIPSEWTNYVASGDKDWYIASFNDEKYAAMTGHKGNQPPFDAYLITPALNLDEAAQKVFSFDSQVAGYGGGDDKMYCYVLSSNDPSTATTIADLSSQVNWAHSSTSAYSGWVASGDIDLSAYSGTVFIAIRYQAESSSSYDTWCIDNFLFGSASGTTPTPPDTDPVTYLSESFDQISSAWTNLVASGDKEWYTASFNDEKYAAMTGYKGTTPPFDAYLISPALNVDGATNKVFSFDSQIAAYGGGDDEMHCYIMSSPDANSIIADVTDQVTWAQGTSSSYSGWVSSGNIDLSSYSGIIYIGIRYYAASSSTYDTWCIDNFLFGANIGEDPGTDPDTPDTPITATRADFESFNSGTATSSYGSYETANGWTAEWCAILSGTDGADDSLGGLFGFLGYATGSTSQFAFAPCMNGRTDRVGKITSPTITGGCGELSFNYGRPYNDNTSSFRVDIKQNGEVVHTFEITENLEKTTVYTHTETVNVSGEFSIEFTNLSPSGTSGGNIDRVCVWNVTWTNY